MNMNDETILENFVKSRNLKPRTKKGYKYSLKQYTDFHQMTLEELLQEAEDEEEQGIRWKHRKLKTRLITFRNWLQDNFLNNTAKKNFGRVTTFYRHHEIEIHQLPPFNEKNSHFPEAITFDKLPDKEIIKHALKITKSPVMRAIILFMSSSGCAMAETLSLTVADFMEATQQYHNKTDIYEALDILKEREDIIPTFRLRRQKNNKFYYTFCTPEATSEIVEYLLSRKKVLTGEDMLFKIHEVWLFTKFAEINDMLNLGKVGEHRRFRSHMLRKYHASYLLNGGMSKDDVNCLQGKSRNSTDESYFYDDPDKLKQKYIGHMAAITINSEVNNIDVKSPEFIEMEHKLEEKEVEVKQMNDRISMIEKRLFDMDGRTNTTEELLEYFGEKLQ